ncbi:MAG: UDP-glucose 4-epimerase GalE, partial [Acidimicrobiia bacterium]|nr:UDP-glucose 4-epimerase GalE [Acidimicrobiia bacterium]
YKAVGESMAKPEMYWSNNVASTEKLLEVLAENKVDKFVFSSSAAVYGTPKSVPVTETMPTVPESVYAETKLAVEKYLGTLAVQAARPINSVSLRYFNAAGASNDNKIGEDWSSSQNLLPRVMRALLDDTFKFEIYGNDYATPDGTCIRDYIHVEDLAVAHLKALEYLETGGNTLVCNIGTGHGTSVMQLIDLAEKIAKRKMPYTVSARRPGDPVSVYADATLANKTLNWRATKSLQQIVDSAYAWHSTHPNGYR